MKIDPSPEATTPDTPSPDDVLMLALTNKGFAKHVLAKAIKGQVPVPPGTKMHHEAERRHNIKAIRQNKIKESELGNPVSARAKPKANSQPTRSSLKPLWNGDQLRQRLQSYDRTPFLDILALWMECIPSPEVIAAFADRYPDRWTKALTDLGRLSGFADKKEIDLNFAAQVARMSDSQLEDQIREQAYRLGIPLPTFLSMLAAPSREAGHLEHPAGLNTREKAPLEIDASAADAEILPPPADEVS